jgi:hypothetical protein
MAEITGFECCPDGFELQNGVCVRVTNVAPFANLENPYLIRTVRGDTQYSSGTRIYVQATNYPLSSQQLPDQVVDSFNFVVPTAAVLNSSLWGDGTASSGRLNAGVGKWPQSNPLNQWVGFSECIDIPETKVYYIGIGGDNRFRLKINGELVINFNILVHPFAYNYWHVFPVLLQAGQNVFEVEAWNDNLNGALGFEIYNASLLQLTTVATTLALQALTLFSSSSVNNFNLSETNGYSCPTGYFLNTCDGNPVCTMIEETAAVACCYRVYECNSPNDYIYIRERKDCEGDLTDIPLGSVVTIAEQEGCYVLDSIVSCRDYPAIEVCVTVLSIYESCNDCQGAGAYLLTNCQDETDTITTTRDISAFIGFVVSLSFCPEKCWTVSETTVSEMAVSLYGNINVYTDCITCLTPTPVEPPQLVSHRMVEPGYNTPGCPPEYVEKVKCKFSDAIYDEYVTRRYGLKTCCDVDLERYLIKYEMLSLDMLYNEELCQVTPNRCCPPCNVQVEITVYETLSCPRPVIQEVEIILGDYIGDDATPQEGDEITPPGGGGIGRDVN